MGWELGQVLARVAQVDDFPDTRVSSALEGGEGGGRGGGDKGPGELASGMIQLSPV